MLHSQGPLLSINVKRRSTREESIDDVLKSFIGGRGVGTRLAHERIPFEAAPLGESNRIYVTTGPLQVSNMSYTGRMSITGISPLTNGLLSSNAGGFLSRNFAETGYSAVELKGASDDLLAIHITDEGVEFEEVPDLKGATISEVDNYIDESRGLGEEHVAAIGPAGENEVRFASVMTTEHRAFGRGGLGAVLGSKNVKAISFDGDSSLDIPIEEVAGDIHREAATTDHIMKRQGTTSVTDLANEIGSFPSYYFQEVSYPDYEHINGDRVEEKKYERATCSQCAFACKLPTRDESRGVETEGPEFETIMSFGGNCDIDDIVSIMQSNDLCDELGMDTISAGNTVAAYLASKDEFGNEELIHDLIKKIARREGIGDQLAEGIHRIHEDLGVDDWTVKGMSFSAHDGRTLNGQGLSFATANRGADHMYSTFYAWEYPLVGDDEAVDPEGLSEKAPLVVEQEKRRAIEDAGILCRFSRGMQSEKRLSDIFDVNYDRLLEIGEQIITLERHFNNSRGLDRDDDSLPYNLPEFQNALDEYYDAHEWEEDGTVPEELVERAASV